MRELDKWQKELEQLSNYAEGAVNKKLFKYYRQALIDIKKEMKVFIENYETLSFSKRLEAERLLENGKQIDKILRETYQKANKAVEEYAKDEAERGYYGTWYAMEGAHNIQLNMNMLPEKYIKQLVHHPVKGKVFSKRLYRDRDRLAKETVNALLDAARKGKSYAVAAKQISELTEASYKRAFRIARTEGGRVQSTAKQRSYVEAKKKGVDLKKKWLSTLDKVTRDSHQYLDGQTVDIEDKFVTKDGHKADGPRLFGVAEEDIHCRCTTITEVNGISPELRRDNEGNEFSYKSYKEWFGYKKKRAESGIIGLNTKDDVQIKGISEHQFDRMIQRNISFPDTKDALINPLEIKKDKIDDQGKVSRKYVGEKTSVVINPLTGNIITTHKTSSKTAEKLKKRGGSS
ncbi:phage head morphogenesis protein [Lederbergia sp. NSJ-179]|uniref:phage minor head protein n=1 Tax=Lederbergia sp. NSJ-179 TaxID=2931402 RepID=UPI001FD5846B|nr:phage minor head protein [Lederbergia sp. NSJ-179]MCJ7839971.1 phage head morphogenesis protein [Lederbergia sp. NSJ-179]